MFLFVQIIFKYQFQFQFCHTRPGGKNHPIGWPKRAIKSDLTSQPPPPTQRTMDCFEVQIAISQQPLARSYPNFKLNLLKVAYLSNL